MTCMYKSQSEFKSHLEVVEPVSECVKQNVIDIQRKVTSTGNQ